MSRSLLPGLIVLVEGYILFFVFYIPEPVITHMLGSDFLQAFYILVEHSMIDGGFICGSWLLLSALYTHRASLSEIGLRKCSPWFFAWVPLFFLIVLVGQGTWVALISAIYTPSVSLPSPSSFFLYANKPITDATALFIFCIFAPVAEEIFFRGLIFRWLLQKYALPTAVIVSALFFAVIHFNLTGFTDYFLVGISNALLAYYAESLWPSITLHVSINILAIALTFTR
jgi:membrane protease YdiL (CAAX protease family)